MLLLRTYIILPWIIMAYDVAMNLSIDRLFIQFSWPLVKAPAFIASRIIFFASESLDCSHRLYNCADKM